MAERRAYDVVVVGGGPAGMTTALYTTRLGHPTAVVEREGGRHAAVRDVHNLYGVSEDVSGSELASHAADQLQEYGGDYYLDDVADVRRADDAVEGASASFHVDADRARLAADAVVFATGFRDVQPDVPGLRRFTGRGLHFCLHCDAYVLGDSPVFVLGHDDHAAEVAMLMLNFTDEVDLLLDGRDPEWSDETARQVGAHPVSIVRREAVGAFARGEELADAREHPEGDTPWECHEDGTPRDSPDEETPWDDAGFDPDAAPGRLGGLAFADGTVRAYRGGFAMYGREYNADLAQSLGCSLADDGAIDVDDDQETTVDDAFAVGDVTHGQNQTTLALADGATAGIAIHTSLREFPRPAGRLDGSGDIEGVGEEEVPGAPPDLRARMRLLRQRGRHAGLRKPAPGR